MQNSIKIFSVTIFVKWGFIFIHAFMHNNPQKAN